MSARQIEIHSQTLYLAIARDIATRKEEEERLLGISHRDDLTGLLNRRGFFAMVDQARPRARRLSAQVLLMYFDVDGLKHVNDRLGHAAGDVLVVAAADTLRLTFRQDDILARIGGDEFVALALLGRDHERLDQQTMLARLERNVADKRARARGRLRLLAELRHHRRDVGRARPHRRAPGPRGCTHVRGQARTASRTQCGGGGGEHLTSMEGPGKQREARVAAVSRRGPQGHDVEREKAPGTRRPPGRGGGNGKAAERKPASRRAPAGDRLTRESGNAADGDLRLALASDQRDERGQERARRLRDPREQRSLACSPETDCHIDVCLGRAKPARRMQEAHARESGDRHAARVGTHRRLRGESAPAAPAGVGRRGGQIRLVIPLLSRNEPWGYVDVQARRSSPPGEQEAAYLQSLANERRHRARDRLPEAQRRQ